MKSLVTRIRNVLRSGRVTEIAKLKLELFYRRVDWRKRTFPDVIIIGSQKSGTSSLFYYLGQHPDVATSVMKEVHYFDGGLDLYVDNYARSERWYRSHFPLEKDINNNRIVVEASPLYMFHPYSARRIHSLLPNVKLIALLRNPTERAISQYFHEKRGGREPLPIAQAFRKEEERLGHAWEKEDFKDFDFVYHSYKARGRYGEQLERFYQYFKKESVLVVSSEDLFLDPRNTLQRIFSFMGVNDEFVPRDMNAVNVGMNKTGVDKSVGQYLDDYFYEYNLQLYDLLGESFNWS